MDRRKKPRQLNLFPVGDLTDENLCEVECSEITVEDVVDQLALIMGEGRFERFLNAKYRAGQKE